MQVKVFLVYKRPPSFDFVGATDGGFALITGAAGGIGRACALEFAAMGINLYLIDYNEDLLGKTTSEIKNGFPKITVKTKVMDLTKMTDPKIYENLKVEFENEKIGILFNNAGIAESKFFRYHESSFREITDLININMAVPALFDRIIIPQMMNRKKGLVMNMGSASAITPIGFLPLYGSSKSFMIHFSQSLQDCYPLHENGITFTAFHPQFVRTPMTKLLNEDWKENNILAIGLKNMFYPTVDLWMKSALKTVGQWDRSTGWYWHELAVWLQPVSHYLASLKEPRAVTREIYRKKENDRKAKTKSQ